MDNLVSILKIPVLNHEVKTKILRLVQSWAIAFEGRGNLGYVGEVYRTLQNEGAYCAEQFRGLVSHKTSRLQLPSARSSNCYVGDGGHADSTGMDRL